MKRFTSSVAAASFVACALAAASASATDDYPPAMKARFKSASEPACTVCHSTNAGGTGTAVKSFSLYLRQRGLVGGNPDSLTKALDAMVGEKHDTDRDGKTDEAELQEGTDPNGALGSNVEPVAYGCGGGRIAPKQPAQTAIWTALAVLAFAAWRRRR